MSCVRVSVSVFFIIFVFVCSSCFSFPLFFFLPPCTVFVVCVFVFFAQVVQTMAQEGRPIPRIPADCLLPLIEFPMRALVFHAQVLIAR